MASSREIARQVGARVRYFRTQRGMSQEKLALECGMNAAFLGHVERGLRCPTVYTLQRICDGLQINIAELFLSELDGDAPGASSIRHVEELMSGLTPQQAKRVARLVDDAAALLQEDA
jgi:transcriptional regulator with XRE-family HTH domain